MRDQEDEKLIFAELGCLAMVNFMKWLQGTACTRTNRLAEVRKAELILTVMVCTLETVEEIVWVAPVSCVHVVRSGDVHTVNVSPVSVDVRLV